MKTLIALLFSLTLSSVAMADDVAMDDISTNDEELQECPAADVATIATEETNPLQSCLLNTMYAPDVRMSWADANIGSMEKDAKMAALKKKYGGYLPLEEFEITPVPLVAFGLIAKGNKKNFRTARNNFIPSYKNRMDDWLQHVPLFLTTGLNIAGYEGRSNLKRYLISGVASYAVMGAFVNGIKYTAKEMRPDGSTANSFPSGHTATAFVAATILHKEYGQTRSPWWSVAGYGMATTTGIMRTLNNRHWISDILVGAGIGVLSTDLGYMIGDLICKDKGINRQRRENMGDMIKNPSFFRFSLGAQFMNNIELPTTTSFLTTARLWEAPGAASLMEDYYRVERNGNPFRIPDSYNADKKTFTNYANNNPAYAENVVPTIKVSVGTSVSAEGAYFFNNYIGAGMRARITTAPVVAEGLYTYSMASNDKPSYKIGTSASDVWSIADVGIGFYGAYPINSRHNIGAKVLYGRRFFSSIDLIGVYDQKIRNIYTDETDVATFYGDEIYIDKADADNLTAGLHYTYATNSGIAISAYVDYDFSRPEFDVEYSPYNTDINKMLLTQSSFSYKQKMRSFSIGASMVVLF